MHEQVTAVLIAAARRRNGVLAETGHGRCSAFFGSGTLQQAGSPEKRYTSLSRSAAWECDFELRAGSVMNLAPALCRDFRCPSVRTRQAMPALPSMRALVCSASCGTRVTSCVKTCRSISRISGSLGSVAGRKTQLLPREGLVARGWRPRSGASSCRPEVRRNGVLGLWLPSATRPGVIPADNRRPRRRRLEAACRRETAFLTAAEQGRGLMRST